ncbi:MULTISPECIES: copper chaperone CopZ [Bacillaceae]|uniref:copper chaperone CopZ n=1 Tax=Bacillaceae TaxID=186817 RepID=UPI001BDF71C7|nr:MULTISPECIES: copper chaperone CopZ [Bacillaceae]MDX8361824.1 copper chaperone CopZ [Cytobacillus sp. IB215316]MDX8366214.1 copper chaperone CopZ [Cytobacillus sp. IB215665]
MVKTTLQVSGMTCGHCEKAVKGALSEVKGVDNVTVFLQDGKVDVEYDDAQVKVAALKEAVEDQGYDVE